MVNAVQIGIILPATVHPHLQQHVLPLVQGATLLTMDLTNPLLHQASFSLGPFTLQMTTQLGRVDFGLFIINEPTQPLTVPFDLRDGLSAVRDAVLATFSAFGGNRLAVINSSATAHPNTAEAVNHIRLKLSSVDIPVDALDVDLKVNVRDRTLLPVTELNRIIRWNTEIVPNVTMGQDANQNVFVNTFQHVMAVCTLDINTAPEFPISADGIGDIYDALTTSAESLLDGSWSSL